jgi:predicted nucleic acid-binding protein
MTDFQYIYWDANVFISYLNNDKDRIATLEAILEAADSSKTDRIVTSVVSKVEVAWVAQEKLRRVLTEDEERKIDDMWENEDVFEMVEFNNEIALKARKLMREGLSQGWKLRTNDAIHLASAQWVGAIELQTYDLKDFEKFSQIIGISIKEPHAIQPKLF